MRSAIIILVSSTNRYAKTGLILRGRSLTHKGKVIRPNIG